MFIAEVIVKSGVALDYIILRSVSVLFILPMCIYEEGRVLETHFITYIDKLFFKLSCT